jgi:predicted secreted protein
VTKTFARIALLSAASTVALAPLADSASASSRTPVYTHADNNETHHLQVGQTFKVRLKACGDCGDSWHWKVRPDSDVLKVTDRKSVSSATPPAVGGINTITWTFKVVGKGDTELRLVERSAQHRNKVVKRFTLHITADRSSR